MNVKEASKMLQIISDPNRLTIVVLLTKHRKMSANEFLTSISCKQATLSHHLNEMVDAELLTFKKKGNKVFYSLNSRKYSQLIYFLGKTDQKEQVEEAPEAAPKAPEKKEEVYRVVDSEIIKKDPVKVELPIYLL